MNATPDKVTREHVFTLAYAIIANPASGLGLDYYNALHAYAEQEGLTAEERTALNAEAERRAHALLAEERG